VTEVGFEFGVGGGMAFGEIVEARAVARVEVEKAEIGLAIGAAVVPELGTQLEGYYLGSWWPIWEEQIVVAVVGHLARM
jgi:hypothetical protein